MSPAITDVAGVLVGHAQDLDALTGCTVVLTAEGATGGVDVRGGAPGTRETDLLDPTAMVSVVRYAHTNPAATARVDAIRQATSQLPGAAEPCTRRPSAAARATRTSVAMSHRVAMCRDLRTDGSTNRRSSTYSVNTDWERCTRTVR